MRLKCVNETRRGVWHCGSYGKQSVTSLEYINIVQLIRQFRVLQSYHGWTLPGYMPGLHPTAQYVYCSSDICVSLACTD